MLTSRTRRAFLVSSARVLAAVTGVSVVEQSTPPRVVAIPQDLAISEALTDQTTFYVSASGSDSADGRSPASAWATIDKANASLPTNGSTVLFQRGDTFYGELNLPAGCEVGAYGVGNKPVLTMFKLLNRPTGWNEYSDGIWNIDLNSPDTHDGYTSTNDANIGYLTVDGEVKPALKFDLSALSKLWDFYCDVPNHTLYVKAPANPTALATDIKAAPNGNAYNVTGRVIYCPNGGNSVHDVHVTGTGGCGIGGTGPDVHIHDCLIDYIGGSWLAGHLDGKQRYGNGIENWVGAKRWLIENNEIAQVYDVAWSPQGSAGSTGGWEDLTFRNNYIHDCTQSFEFWSTGDSSAPGFQRILVEGNLCERAGYSVFSDVRPDQNVRVHLLSYPWETPADIIIQNNVFDDAYGAYSYHMANPAGLVTRNNTIRLKAGHKMQFQMPQTVEQAKEWQVATGQEVGSTVTVL